MIIFFLFLLKIGENCISVYSIFFKITVSEAHCHIINYWCFSLEVFFLSILTSQGPGIHFKGYRKCITSNILIQNVERSKMYSLYSVHVMSCHCCMFTENHHFDIFGIEWDRNIIITVISDHLSHAISRWLVYFSFTKLIRHTPTKWSCDCCNSTLLCLQSGCSGAWNISYYHLLTQAIMPILN